MAFRYDPVLLEIFRSLYAAVAEEMGVTLRRTAFSPNIKERRDYSCAVFDSRGELLAHADATILSDRRRFRPYGLAGGKPAKPGRTLLLRKGRRIELPSKCRFPIAAGESLIVETPGGGGWGARDRRKTN